MWKWVLIKPWPTEINSIPIPRALKKKLFHFEINSLLWLEFLVSIVWIMLTGFWHLFLLINKYFYFHFTMRLFLFLLFWIQYLNWYLRRDILVSVFEYRPTLLHFLTRIIFSFGRAANCIWMGNFLIEANYELICCSVFSFFMPCN